jgi:hypothetical protein
MPPEPPGAGAPDAAAQPHPAPPASASAERTPDWEALVHAMIERYPAVLARLD